MYLPSFLSRKEQDTLLILLKNSIDIHIIEALYIGLRKTSPKKVNQFLVDRVVLENFQGQTISCFVLSEFLSNPMEIFCPL